MLIGALFLCLYKVFWSHAKNVGNGDQVPGRQIPGVGFSQLHSLDLADIHAGFLGEVGLRHLGHAARPF